MLRLYQNLYSQFFLLLAQNYNYNIKGIVLGNIHLQVIAKKGNVTVTYSSENKGFKEFHSYVTLCNWSFNKGRWALLLTIRLRRIYYDVIKNA